MFATFGTLLRWTPEFYCNLDVTWTDWSEFAYAIDGVGKLNPFDGTPHGQNPIEDTLAARFGVEYIWITRFADIPFRGGLIWDERPAPGEPDAYTGFSLGSGVAFGKEGKRWIFDIAYQYLHAEGVRSVSAEQEGLSTDAEQHSVFLSLIKHF